MSSSQKAASRFIPVAAPVLAGREKEYVLNCLESGWISSTGEYVRRFETEFAAFCGTRHAVSCCNGTVALHLALEALGVGPGDEVILPTLTFVATANAVLYCGATPVFADCDATTWNLSPGAVETLITPRTKAIVAVHLYGLPSDMAALRRIAETYKLKLVEDAAEAFGAEFHGRRAGGLGEVATFSFYGNKTISTGEGGMLTTDDEALAARIRQLRGQGMDPTRRYWFPIRGFNYRMTNIAAAIGLGQLEQADWHLQRRREIVNWYNHRLDGIVDLQRQYETDRVRHGFWIHTVILDGAKHPPRDRVMQRLAALGIETRPVFYPMHALPFLSRYAVGQSFPEADRLARNGMNLPTWAGLSEADVDWISQQFIESIHT